MVSKITKLYEELKPVVHPEYNWLFSTSLASKIREPFSVQVAWVDSVRQLCPDKYSAVVCTKGDKFADGG